MNKDQAHDDAGRKRWFVYTDKGRKVTWAMSEQEARAKAVKLGLVVRRVTAAPPLK
jgi:hypothetical protein